MPSAGLVGKGSYVFFGSESSFKGGIAGKHKPMNPMAKLTIGKMPKYIQAQFATFVNMYHDIEYDEKLDIGEISIQTLLRDPFILLSFMDHKTCPSPWTGSSDTITGNFSDNDDEESIWMQMHVHNNDGTNHLNLLFVGGKITKYRWIIEAGKPVMEEFDIKFASVSVSTTACDIDAGFDDGVFDISGVDGGFSLWDGAYTRGTAVQSKDCTITWGGSAITGLYIKRCVLEVDRNAAYHHIYSSLTANHYFTEIISPYKATLEGQFKGNQDVAEFLAAYDSKTKATFKILYGTDKYMQFTLGYIQDIGNLGIPEAGKPAEGSYTIAGGAGSTIKYNWTATEATDPRNFITF